MYCYAWQELVETPDSQLKERFGHIDYWVGWSLGGLVLLDALAADRLNAKKLLLLGASPRFCSQPEDEWPGMARTELQRLQHAVTRNPVIALKQFYRRFNLTPPNHLPEQAGQLADPNGLQWLAEKDLRGELALLSSRISITLLLGEQDPLINPDWPDWFESLGAEWQVIAGMGHDWPQRTDLYPLLEQYLPDMAG